MACNLDIPLREAGGELDRSSEWCRDGYDVRTINEPGLPKNLELSHGCLEFRHHTGLVVYGCNQVEKSE